MRFARLLLGVQAAIMLGLGLAYWWRPYEMANLNGMLLMESASVSHLRVYYGGMQWGLAAFLLCSLRSRAQLRAGLGLILALQLALLLARLLAFWQEAGALQTLDLTALVYKALAASLAAFALARLREVPAARETSVEAGEAPAPVRRGAVQPSIGASPRTGEPPEQPLL